MNILTDSPFNDDLDFIVGKTSGDVSVNGTVDRETFSRYFVSISVCHSDTTLNSIVVYTLYKCA